MTSAQRSPAAHQPAFGALVVSLDFELHWGVRDRHGPHGDTVERLLGAREVIPRMLDLFQELDVAATWAVVGFLFATSWEELRRFAPALRPGYADRALDPYLEPVGPDEASDPLHFAPSLIARIRRTPRQEIATHTFSHFTCGERGQDAAAFRADLAAARDIAAARGIRFRSIVFPRNQHNPAYDGILRDAGIRAYRGTPPTGAWSFSTHGEAGRPWKQARRLAESYVGGGSDGLSWSEVLRPSGLSDVRATAMLRPFRPGLRLGERARLARVRRGLLRAAEHRRIFHLWWHPHNFGVHPEENLRFLREVLTEFAHLRDRFGMRSLSMAEVDSLARTRSANADDRFVSRAEQGR